MVVCHHVHLPVVNLRLRFMAVMSSYVHDTISVLETTIGMLLW
jgi:hypothetical protein